MKKLMITVAALAMSVAANAGTCWSWWVGDDKADATLEGCQIGIADECRQMTGAQVSLLWGRAEKVNGCQFAFGYCNVGKLINGPQVSFVNVAREGAAIQVGLLNWNPKGFLPFFPFFNFSTKLFGDRNK